MTSSYRDICMEVTPKSIWIHCRLLWSTIDANPLVSLIKRSSWHATPPKWGRTENVRGNWPPKFIHRPSRENQTSWFSLLVLWVRWRSQCPFAILHLPHSGTGSQQLLLSKTDTFVTDYLTSDRLDSINCSFAGGDGGVGGGKSTVLPILVGTLLRQVSNS